MFSSNSSMYKMMRITVGFLGLCLLLLTACGGRQEEHPIDFHYTDITEEAGIDFVHEKPVFDSKVDRIMPWLASTGAGVFTADYDQDGYMDLYMINSARGSLNHLYRNLGDGTFEEVGEVAGVADVNQEGVSETALWFDYNNDGYPDLFVGTWSSESKLFENNQDGTFTDVSEATGLSPLVGNFNKAVAIDYDRDGWLDLYVGGYFHEQHNMFALTTTRIMHNDFERARNGGRNVMLRNEGGTFTDVSDALGVADTGWTLAVGAADVNQDGWTDLYNANDFGADTFYLNEKGQRFRQVVQSRGIGEDTFKGMNVDFADVFHDGRLAMYVTNVSKPLYILEGNQLWHEDESGTYVDRSIEMGIQLADFSWGARFFDADNKGEFSLAVATGFISASKKRDYWFDLGTLATTPGTIVEDADNWMDFEDKSLSGYEQSYLFWNDGNRFSNVAAQAGITFDSDSRGVAPVDLDNDGDLDLVFANQGTSPNVYQAEVNPDHHWIKLKLTGTMPSNRDAVGARVTFEVGGTKTVMERDGGNSHGAQADPRLHFGLDDAERVDRITIQWPSGRVQVLENVQADQILSVMEPDTPLPVSDEEQR
ncbi:CRTAC1 family protein [Marinicrinis sediminis]|uniref:CRTAC1 family protein n=1 Tax=Marinicrinis sediminis TaxID=1652465 RepID=A0ABW5RGX2_9BACL